MSGSFGPLDILNLYENGVFPMADCKDDPRILVVEPFERGIIPIYEFHIPRRFKRDFAKHEYKITVNKAFRQVIEECAQETENRKETWINRQIIQGYDALHRMNYAHSLEVWDKEELVGGLYGVSLHQTFFGESMFSRRTNTSKIALVHLVAALKFANYKILDAQFKNDHLAQFGLYGMPQEEFKNQLSQTKNLNAIFPTKQFENLEANSLALPHYCLQLLAQ